MADTTEPTRDPTGAPIAAAPHRYAITATVVDGGIRLSGENVTDGVVEVPRGEDAIIEIRDVDGFYLYAAEVPPGGERAACWGRNTKPGLTRRRFSSVASEINNIIYAASTRDSAEVTYGPILKVKPKG